MTERIGDQIPWSIVGIAWWVAVALILLLGFEVYILAYVDIPKENQSALLVLIGVTSTGVGTIVNFCYSTSAANRAKDAVIATQSNTIATAQNALTPNITPNITTTTTTSNAPPSSPVVATVKTPDIEVPLHAGDKATVQADPKENKV